MITQNVCLAGALTACWTFTGAIGVRTIGQSESDTQRYALSMIQIIAVYYEYIKRIALVVVFEGNFEATMKFKWNLHNQLFILHSMILAE